MELSSAVSFASARTFGVLGTIRRDGRPQLSNIMYVAVDGAFRISLTATRAKTKNLRRDPRCTLYVPGDDHWNFVVLDGEASLTNVATMPDDDAVEQLVDYYRRGSGEHPDWDDYRARMVRDQRLLATFRPTTAYGMLQS